MSHIQFVTFYVLGGIVALIAVSDIALYRWKGIDATYSRTLLKYSRRWLIVPVIIGAVVGHIFWTNCGEPKNKVECARAGD